jgi:hypothetical protein
MAMMWVLLSFGMLFRVRNGIFLTYALLLHQQD